MHENCICKSLDSFCLIASNMPQKQHQLDIDCVFERTRGMLVKLSNLWPYWANLGKSADLLIAWEKISIRGLASLKISFWKNVENCMC